MSLNINSFFKYILIITIGIFFSGCQKKPLIETHLLLGSYCKITIPASEKYAKEALKKAFDRITEIDTKFNVLNVKSPLYDFNIKETPIHDQEIVNLIKTAFKINNESNGAFDPTIYPIIILWGFYGENPALPLKNDIQKKLNDIGIEKISIRDNVLYPAQKNAGIDLGGIVSGYSADEVVKILKNLGIKSALIDTGGELYALGTNNGKKWKIGLKNPRGEGIIGVIEAEDEAVSTSGDYEKYFIKDGKRYHHILDPKTGYPAQGIESVTIICQNVTEADTWSTAFFVLGVEKGFEIINKKPGFKAIVITDKGKLIASKGMENQFSLIKDQK